MTVGVLRCTICHPYACHEALPFCLQEKQRVQQEQVCELSEHVAELEERQRSLNRALESYRQVSIACERGQACVGLL